MFAVLGDGSDVAGAGAGGSRHTHDEARVGQGLVGFRRSHANDIGHRPGLVALLLPQIDDDGCVVGDDGSALGGLGRDLRAPCRPPS